MQIQHRKAVQILIAAFLYVGVFSGQAASAQSKPTPAQAQALLQNPAAIAQLRQQLQSSGMTPEQVRSRLRAEGYPESLLDSYLVSGTSSGGAVPNADVLAAVRALGIVSDADVEEMLQRSQSRPTQPVPVPTDPSFTLFGLSLFRESSSLFLPNLDGPVDANYRLGPGDQLVLILTGDVELAHTLDVTREGFVVIPQVGQIAVANLSLAQLEDVLYSRLSRSYSGIRRGSDATTRFSISVSRLRSNQVFVTGDVVTPGSYRVTSAGTALSALYAAGGPTDQGSLRAVQVRRGGRTVATLDVYDYLLRGDASNDVRLQQGDVVFVPVHGPRARVTGAVTRPATYELKPTETLADVIRAAGGLAAAANARRVLVERIVPAADRSADAGRDRAVIDVPVTDGIVAALPVSDGDVVTVPTISDRVVGRVAINGHVWNPGPQGFTPGLTLTDALQRAGGVQPDAYLPVVHVSRLRPDSTRVQLRVALTDVTGGTAGPFALQEDDEVTIYSRTSFRPEQFVVITGSVRSSGRYPWREGMTLRDLVLQAGGLRRLAWVREAEIARVPTPRDANVLATTVRVPIDSSYFADAPRSPQTAEVPLMPFDNVLILLDPEAREERQVTVTGEVRFPGTYTLKSRGERLSDLVVRAGGLTTEADASAAWFARLSDSAVTARIEREAARRRTGTSDSSSTDTVGADNAEENGRFRVGVDLPALIRSPSRPDNVVLAAGDSLHIPERQTVVQVRGAVNAPSALAYDGARSLGYYVGAAGGPTPKAAARRAYVVQPNGKIESRSYLLGVIKRDPTPRPGAVVVVPERDLSGERTSLLQTLAVTAQIIASLATVVLITR